jgi:hypothetical protein
MIFCSKNFVVKMFSLKSTEKPSFKDLSQVWLKKWPKVGPQRFQTYCITTALHLIVSFLNYVDNPDFTFDHFQQDVPL